MLERLCFMPESVQVHRTAGSGPVPGTKGKEPTFALLPPPPKSFHFSVVLLLLKGIAVSQTLKGARNQWFWLLNRKRKALPVPLSWLEGLGLK